MRCATEQFPAVAAELVKAQVDAIVAGGAAAARAAQAATRTIPIFTLTDDMVGQGLVGIAGTSRRKYHRHQHSCDRARRQAPGNPDGDAAPPPHSVLADANTAAPENMRELQEAARARGVELAVRLVERPERIVPEIEEARRAGAEALNVLASPILYARRLDIFERTAALRLPAIYQSPEFAEEGGLIGYGPRITQMFRQLARQLAKVFIGEKVSDVPVEQPTTFELAINLQAAQGDRFRGATIARAARRQGDRMKRRDFITLVGGGGVADIRARASSRRCRWSCSTSPCPVRSPICSRASGRA